MSKKVTYINLLKEAIAEFDTSDTVDVKGPMLDPILSWQGDGELPTNKDAASILERYYFNENRDEGVGILDEMGYENDKGQIGDSKAMKDAEGEGTEQAGTSPAKNIQGAKKDKEKDIAKEDVDLSEQDEEDVEMAKDEDEDEKEEMEEGLDVEEAEDFHGGDVKDAIEEEAPVKEEKEATSSEEDAKGAGTQQAGTGNATKELPPRKDRADQAVKSADVPQDDKISDSVQAALDDLEVSILEQDEEDEPPAPTGDEDEDEDEKLDVDKEMKEQAAPSAVPGGPSPKKTGEDAEEDVYEEAFKIFKEAIEEEIEDIDTDNIKV